MPPDGRGRGCESRETELGSQQTIRRDTQNSSDTAKRDQRHIGSSLLYSLPALIVNPAAVRSFFLSHPAFQTPGLDMRPYPFEKLHPFLSAHAYDGRT